MCLKIKSLIAISLNKSRKAIKAKITMNRLIYINKCIKTSQIKEPNIKKILCSLMHLTMLNITTQKALRIKSKKATKNIKSQN